MKRYTGLGFALCLGLAAGYAIGSGNRNTRTVPAEGVDVRSDSSSVFCPVPVDPYEFTVHHDGGSVITYRTHIVVRDNTRVYFTGLTDRPVTTVTFDGGRLRVSGTPVTGP